MRRMNHSAIAAGIITGLILAFAQGVSAIDTFQGPPAKKQVPPAMAQLQGKLQQLEGALQELARTYKDLRQNKPQPPVTGGGEDPQKKAYYEQQLHAWENKIEQISMKIKQIQEKLQEVQSQLQKLRSQGLPAARNKDEENSRRAMEEAQRELEGRANSLHNRIVTFNAGLLNKHPGNTLGATPATLSGPPVPRSSLQQSTPSMLIPPRPFTVNKETMDRLARTPLKVPSSLTGQEHQALREIAGQITAQDTKSATNGWSTLLTTLNRKNVPVDCWLLIQYALRESYIQSTKDLQSYADKVKYFNESKKQARREIANLRDQLQELRSGKPKTPSGKPPYPADRYAETQASLSKSLEHWEGRLSKLNDDGQMANMDLQNALQRQQQTLQILSTVSKMMHDTAMAVIRKTR